MHCCKSNAMSKFILILFFISFWSANSYGQHNRSMEPNRFSYVSIGQGIQYTAVKVAYDIRPNLYLELQVLSDGGGIWKSNNSFNDIRALSVLRTVNIALLRTQFRAGIGILQSRENLPTSFMDLGVIPQLNGIININKKVNIGVSVVWPISSARNLILPTTTFCVEYRIGRYVKENGLH